MTRDLPTRIAGYPADLVCTFRCPKCETTVAMAFYKSVFGGEFSRVDRVYHVDRLGAVVQTDCRFVSWGSWYA